MRDGHAETSLFATPVDVLVDGCNNVVVLIFFLFCHIFVHIFSYISVDVLVDGCNNVVVVIFFLRNYFV
jgi:hypothetical protein